MAVERNIARVLLIDDDPTSLEFFQEVLAPNSWTIETASTVEKGISAAEARSYSLICCNLDSQNIDLELIERLSFSCPHSSLLVAAQHPDLTLTSRQAARMITCVITQPRDAARVASAFHNAYVIHCRRGNQPDPEDKRILVVEDGEADADLLLHCLKNGEANYEVNRARRLSEAISLIGEEEFDLVVTDLCLPDARGVDAVARLQANSPATPIIFISGTDDRSAVMHAVHLGAQGYLHKSEITAASLERAITYAIERKATQSQLNFLASHDQLTGLANRDTLRRQLAVALRRASRQNRIVGLMMLDLDRFKTINDTLGHGTGDALLIEVAELLRGCVRSCDTVARLGGDEFAILLEDYSEHEQLTAPAQRILLAMRKLAKVSGADLNITTSIGIATYPENGIKPAELIKCADSAMYRAKKLGRDNYQFFDAKMHEESLRKVSLERDLWKALAQDEFELYYQPLVSAGKNGETQFSFEALLRWNHPRRGCIGPDEFIPILEANRHIVPVGEWVLQRACEQAAHWSKEHGKPVRVAVNVSVRQFDDDTFIQKVARALESSGLPAEQLDLEITENLLMRNVDAAVQTLRSLKSLGVKISIDDFGTGFSRLTYLAKFPLDLLKIDRSVIDSIGSKAGDSIVRAVIDLGHALDLDLIGEGVETEEQLDFLRSANCDFFQGYFFARPMNASGAGDWLRKELNEVPVTAAEEESFDPERLRSN